MFVLVMITYFKPFLPVSTTPRDLSLSSEKSRKVTYLLFSILIGVGIFFRLFHFFDNRSLWIDEIYLGISLITMDFWELATSSLEYQQKAPIGFLWLVKLSILLFGKGEMALRLVPLLCGIASLFIFLPVVRYFLRPVGAVLAMGILALAPVMVYHSVEIKQYCIEMLATILALYLYTRYANNFSTKSLLIWGLWGALIFWFSYSAVFILGGIAVGLGLHDLLRKDWNKLFLSMIPFSLWLISFGVNFYLFMYQHTDSDWLVEWFRNRGGFIPHNASAVEVVGWLFQSLYASLEYPLSILWSAYQFEAIGNPVLVFFLKMAPLVFLCWIIGYVMLFKKSKKHFLVLLVPFVLTLLAAVLGKYPFYERLIFFLAPIPIIVIALGCQKLTNALPPAVGKLRFVLPLLLLLWPIYRSTAQAYNTDWFAEFGDSNKKTYYRDGFLYLKEHIKEGDLVYIYWNAEHIYDYYNEAYDLDLGAIKLPDLRSRSTDADDYFNRLKPSLAGAFGEQRVWYVYDPFVDVQIGDYEYQYPWYRMDDNVRGGRLLHKKLSAIGQEVDTFRGKGTVVSLFDLSK